jgi:hypothetical protein
MSIFPWGKVIERFVYDFEGDKVEIVKYHPHLQDTQKRVREIDTNKVWYHLEDHHVSHSSIEACLLTWMAEKHLGLNHHTLVSGICRALNIKE